MNQDKNSPQLDILVDTVVQLGRLIAHCPADKNRHATILQIHLLQLLQDHQDLSMSDISSHTQMSLSSATQLVERLAKDELINRQHDKTDRRVVRIALTPKGQQHLNTMRQARYDRLKEIFSHVPEQDLAELIRIQRHLINELNAGTAETNR